MNSWRCLFETEPREPALNMAIDQSLLELVESGRLDEPVLRVYAWKTPTLSLGYHQQWRKTADPDALARHGVALVRRLTGGRAVLHEPDEITYAVVAPMKPPFTARIKPNYRLIGAALNRFVDLGAATGAMAADEPPVEETRRMRHAPCFASLSQAEIEARGRKMIGSSQKLGKRGFLQHGSVPLRARPEVLAAVTRSGLDMGAYMTSLDEHYREAGMVLPPRTALVERLKNAFEAALDARFSDLGELGLTLEAEAARIARERFAADAWTFRK